MDFVHFKPRMNLGDDRLSVLPDDLIHKILSFISLKYAIRTSGLSSRWRFLWTSMPYFNISTDDFHSLHHLSEFVNHLFSGRNSHIEVHSVELSFLRHSFHRPFSDALLKRILDYAFSHNVQKLSFSCLFDEEIDFPLHLFRSQSLKYLRLSGCDRVLDPFSIILASTWELQALTTLHLDNVSFYEESLVSKCANLKNLTLNNFEGRSESFTVCHPRLFNLTIKDGFWGPKAVNVVAPQLKNLTIRSCFARHHITVPNLASLVFRDKSFSGSGVLQFSTELPYLEKVDLCVFSRDKWNGCRISALLQQLRNVKFLTLNLEFVEPLISYMERISLQPSPFSNLESLKIYPVYIHSDDEAHKKVNLTSKVMTYLLDGSPSATFTLISYEEIKEKQQKAQAIANAATAESLMASLLVLLEKEKANIETDGTRMSPMGRHEENSTDEEKNETEDQVQAPVERMQLHFKRKMAQMKRCWEDVGTQIDQGKRNTRNIISRLRDIEVLLLKDLPSSKRDELQACFSSLCAEVDIVVKKILHHMMIPQNKLSDCFNELATTSLQSS
ncbi:hypothetical protein SSX86_020554 [Deinandra increscens subsp. villosa]|uniref:F-box domain-containing protein n=1 Tax=Deinandra increscens subsp. villosa TaxID=3103831 RepID=A0AAP0GUS9_9ASTR